MEILEKRIHKIITRISGVADFQRIAAVVLRGDSNVIVSGLSGSARALFIAGLWQSLRRPVIVVTPQDRGLEPLATDIAYFHGELNANGAGRVCPFPAWETDPYAGLTPHADILQARATTLWRMRATQVDDILPMQDVVISREMLREWGGRARQRWNDDRYQKDLHEKLVFADNGELFPGALSVMPVVQPMESTLLDYADAAMLILDEPESLEETHQKFFSALEQRFEQTEAAGGVAVRRAELFISPDDLRAIRGRRRRISLEELGASGSSFFIK